MPPGMKCVGKNNFIIFEKCIHGLVQAARQYKMKAAEILKKVGSTRDNVDLHLYMKKSENGTYVCM